MIVKEYTILDQHGMHARPATALLKLSRLFKSEIGLKKDDKSIQLKSMLNILSMGLKYGEKVSVIISGEDESDAAEAIDTFFIKDMKTF
jgi:phosphocarrier protein HPr